MIHYRYSDEKTLQAATLIANYRGGETDYGSIGKLLYIADRISISTRGAPITGDQMLSMEHGLTLSGFLDRIRALPEDSAWATVFEKGRGYGRRVVNDPGMDALSPADVRILNQVLSEHGKKSFIALKNLTHDESRFPEYQDVGRGGVASVDPRAILRDSDVSEEDIKAIAAEARTLAYAYDD